jgi:hypothetical protein
LALASVEYPDLLDAFINLSPSQQNNTQHQRIVTDFKNEISNILYLYSSQLGYNISLQYCQDLAWNGLERTDAYQKLTQGEKNRVYEVINHEHNGINTKGLKPSGC